MDGKDGPTRRKIPMTIRINPPVPPPTLEGPAIVQALIHIARTQRAAPSPDQIRVLVEYRNPRGTDRAMHAMQIMLQLVLDIPTYKTPPPPPVVAKKTPLQMANQAVAALHAQSTKGPLTWPEIQSIILRAVS